jgi:hypothetical protein
LAGDRCGSFAPAASQYAKQTLQSSTISMCLQALVVVVLVWPAEEEVTEAAFESNASVMLLMAYCVKASASNLSMMSGVDDAAAAAAAAAPAIGGAGTADIVDATEDHQRV